ncbi:hypothetical protein AVEN_150583-1, partial [Araneus ventricosus]
TNNIMHSKIHQRYREQLSQLSVGSLKHLISYHLESGELAELTKQKTVTAASVDVTPTESGSCTFPEQAEACQRD